MTDEDDEPLLRSAALKNAHSILLARDRAEQELLKTRDALQQTTRRLQLAMEAGQLGEWSWDAASDLITLGPLAARIFSLAQDVPITSVQMREILHDDDRERARLAVEGAIAQKSDYNIEYRVHRPFGEYLWVLSRGRAHYTDDGVVQGMIGVVQDISQRRFADDVRRQLLESERAARLEAERASAIKDEFLATLSHELRTPLNAILGWTQVLKRELVDLPQAKHGLDTIERNTRIQTQLIDDLLDMSRITAGKLRLEFETLDPLPIIAASIATLAPLASPKAIRIKSALDPAAGPVQGDPARLQQIVWNLLSNAIKFTPKEGVIEVALRRVDSQVELSIADTGFGISEEFLPFVFDRFRQQNASMTRRFGGLGLGLSIVKHLVELHGGSVAVVSQGVGRGSEFSVRLPLVARTEPALHSGSSPAELSDYAHTDLSGLFVLVVDDEPDACDLLRRLLSECGASVITASSAQEAISVLQQEGVSVLVSDIGMPGEDGYDLLRRWREINFGKSGRVPAIALTAYAGSEDRTRALRAGFAAHIAKPVEPAEFITTVASVVGRVGH